MNKQKHDKTHFKTQKKERSFSQFTRDKLQSDYNPTIRKHSMFPGLRQKPKKYSLTLKQQQDIKNEIVQNIRQGKQIQLNFSDVDTFRFTSKKFSKFPTITNSVIQQINHQNKSKEKKSNKKNQKIGNSKIIKELLHKVLDKGQEDQYGSSFIRQNTCVSSVMFKNNAFPDNLIRSQTQQISLTNSMIQSQPPFSKTQKEKYQQLISKVSGKIRLAKAFHGKSQKKKLKLDKVYTQPNCQQSVESPQKNRRERVLDAQRQILQKSKLVALKDSLQQVFHQIRSAFPFQEQSSPKVAFNTLSKDNCEIKSIEYQ